MTELKSVFRAFDKYYISKNEEKIRMELLQNPSLALLIVGLEREFIRWAAEERLSYYPDLPEEIQDFLNRNFLQRKRMNNVNVKAWRLVSRQVFKRDNYRCVYCGSTTKLEVDHIFPFSKGGSDNLDNLATSCQKCNRQKRDKTVEEFNAWRADRL